MEIFQKDGKLKFENFSKKSKIYTLSLFCVKLQKLPKIYQINKCRKNLKSQYGIDTVAVGNFTTSIALNPIKLHDSYGIDEIPYWLWQYLIL